MSQKLIVTEAARPKQLVIDVCLAIGMEPPPTLITIWNRHTSRVSRGTIPSEHNVPEIRGEHQ